MSTGARTTIALDAMSGDHGHPVVVQAALSFLREAQDVRLILVGQESQLHAAFNGRIPDAIEIQHAGEVVGMDELPSRALRAKKDSSMRVAINLVKQGRAQACVSAGNTGALMGIAKFVLKTLPGIDRPAILSPLPTIKGYTHMLDLGANAACTAEQLFQFAVMGSVLVTATDGVPRPRVGLLNIGSEEIKGVESVRQAASLIQQAELNYVGFIEGDDIFSGDVDVVVCDGFAGNVALKTSEGVAKLVRQFMKEEFTRNALTKLSAIAAKPVLNAFAERIDPRRYNGASFLGLRGVVIKSHGGADEVAFANAIRVAQLEVQKAVPTRISNLLATTLGEDESTDPLNDTGSWSIGGTD